ncbi:sugar-binding protein [Microbacterium sp. NPDC055683]
MPTSRRRSRAIVLAAALATAAGLLAAGPAHAGLAESESFDGWTTTVSGTPSFTIAADTAVAHDGDVSARIDVDAAAGTTSYVDLRQSIRANGGTTYEMSAWVRTESLSTAGAAYFVLSGDHSQRVELPVGTNDWTRLEWTYTQPAGSMTFVMRLLARGAGTVWVDDVRMTAAGHDTNLVVNPSFEDHQPPPGTLAFSDTALVYEKGHARIGLTTVADAVDWEVRASSGQRIDTGTAAATGGEAAIDLDALPAGYYRVAVSIDAPLALAREASFVVVEPSSDVPGADRPIGVAAHVNRYSTEQIDALMDPLDVGTLREGPSWDAIETSPGVYEFPALFDAQIAEAKARGERPLVILAYFSRWYDEGKTPSSPEGIAAFAAYAAAAAAHYGPDVDYEVYNEFNHTFNTGACGMTAACYNDLLVPAAAAIHAAAPGARVVGPVSAGAKWDFLEDLFALGALDHLDAVSYHTYDFPTAPEGRTEAGVATLRALIDEYAPGSDIPIWLTEHGWTTTTGGTTERQQAAYVVRSAALLEAAGVERVVFYELIDSGANPAETEHNFGLARRPADGGTALAPKPSYAALAAYDRFTAARDLVAVERLDGAIVADFADASGGITRMAWSTGDDPVALSIGTAASARVATGDGRSWRALPDAQVEITVGPEPVFVVGAMGGTSVVADPGARIDAPDAIARGAGADAAVSLDRTTLGVEGDLVVAGPVGAGTTIAGTAGTVSLAPMRELGDKPLTYTVRSGDAVVALVQESAAVVESPVLAVTPTADGGLELSASNVAGAGDVAVEEIEWSVGDESGAIPSFTVADGASTAVALSAAVTPWTPYAFSVSATADGEPRALSGTTASAPVERRPSDAVVVDWRTAGEYVALSGGRADADDLGGTFSVSWKDEGLRIHARVEDDDHSPSSTADRLWSGDSVQFAVAAGLPGDDPSSRVELGVHPDASQPSVYRYTTPVGAVDDVELEIEREGTTTSYDVVVPWDLLGIDPGERVFSFSLLANDADGGVREGFLEWGSGIGASKDSRLFVPVVLVGGGA